MKLKGIIVSGYFNPLHKGHLELFEKAKAQGDTLFVIVNNDYQRTLKGSQEFMLEDERVQIITSLAVTDTVVLSIDQDGSVCDTLKQLHQNFGSQYELFFANGGDQNNTSIPEAPVCKKLGIGLLEVPGDKIQSSSWLLKKRNEN